MARKKRWDINAANKQAKKQARQHRNRARRNHQDMISGAPTRPAKKQGCLSMSALLMLAAAGGVIGIIAAARGLA